MNNEQDSSVTCVCLFSVCSTQLNSRLSGSPARGLALSRIGVPVCACSVDPCEILRRVACDAYLPVFDRV